MYERVVMVNTDKGSYGQVKLEDGQRSIDTSKGHFKMIIKEVRSRLAGPNDDNHRSGKGKAETDPRCKCRIEPSLYSRAMK